MRLSRLKTSKLVYGYRHYFWSLQLLQLNHLLPFLHLQPIPWLTSESWSKVAVWRRDHGPLHVTVRIETGIQQGNAGAEFEGLPESVEADDPAL